MEAILQYNETIAVLIARVFLGFLFFFQGYDAVFNIKIKNVAGVYSASFSDKGIPAFFTLLGSWFTSLVELIGGLLLIVGLFKYIVLTLLGFNLIIASVAFGITQPMWDMKYVFPRLVLLIFLLMTPANLDCCSLDNLILTLKYN